MTEIYYKNDSLNLVSKELNNIIGKTFHETIKEKFPEESKNFFFVGPLLLGKITYEDIIPGGEEKKATIHTGRMIIAYDTAYSALRLDPQVQSFVYRAVHDIADGYQQPQQSTEEITKKIERMAHERYLRLKVTEKLHEQEKKNQELINAGRETIKLYEKRLEEAYDSLRILTIENERLKKAYSSLKNEVV